MFCKNLQAELDTQSSSVLTTILQPYRHTRTTKEIGKCNTDDTKWLALPAGRCDICFHSQCWTARGWTDVSFGVTLSFAWSCKFSHHICTGNFTAKLSLLECMFCSDLSIRLTFPLTELSLSISMFEINVQLLSTQTVTPIQLSSWQDFPSIPFPHPPWDQPLKMADYERLANGIWDACE